MPTDLPPNANHSRAPGLPAVKPPTARFILQLFLIPGFIVAGLILVFVIGSLAWVGTSKPETYLANLDNPNPEVRWRAAHELAQVLKRPESVEIGSNPDFALDLAERLQKALVELEKAEDAAKAELANTFVRIKNDKSFTSAEQRSKAEEQAALTAWRQLRSQRDLVLYLTSCLGDFSIPVGVHALAEVAMKDKSAEIKGLSLRRRRAVWALGNLGNNMQQRFFGKNPSADTKVLTPKQKSDILDKLAKAATGDGNRAKVAKYTFDVLSNKAPSQVDDILAFCAKSEDVFLREVTALALNFWDGPLVQPTLLLLARDDGHGVRIEIIDD